MILRHFAADDLLVEAWNDGVGVIVVVAPLRRPLEVDAHFLEAFPVRLQRLAELFEGVFLVVEHQLLHSHKRVCGHNRRDRVMPTVGLLGQGVGIHAEFHAAVVDCGHEGHLKEALLEVARHVLGADAEVDCILVLLAEGFPNVLEGLQRREIAGLRAQLHVGVGPVVAVVKRDFQQLGRKDRATALGAGLLRLAAAVNAGRHAQHVNPVVGLLVRRAVAIEAELGVFLHLFRADLVVLDGGITETVTDALEDPTQRLVPVLLRVAEDDGRFGRADAFGRLEDSVGHVVAGILALGVCAADGQNEQVV